MAGFIKAHHSGFHGAIGEEMRPDFPLDLIFTHSLGGRNLVYLYGVRQLVTVDQWVIRSSRRIPLKV